MGQEPLTLESPPLPAELADIFAMNAASAIDVASYFARTTLDPQQRARRPDLPDSASCGLISREYELLLGREARVPGTLTPQALGLLLQEIEGRVTFAVRKAGALPSDLWPTPIVDSRPIPPEIGAIEGLAEQPRRLECFLILMAQLELRPLWNRIQGAWPVMTEEQLHFLLSDDISLLSDRAPHMLWPMTVRSSTGLTIEESEPIPQPGLPRAYWLTRVHYLEQSRRFVHKSGRVCEYCGQPYPPDRQWREDIRTCGRKACERQHEADRRWYRRHEAEVGPVVQARLNLPDRSNLHPAVARREWDRVRRG